jgi:uncharacterized membrane protein
MLFLIPFVVVVVVAGKALQLMRMIAKPLVELFDVERVGMIATIDLVAIGLMVALCYIAGRVAVSERGRQAYRALDERLLDIFPRYGFVKAIASGVAKERAERIRPVLVRFDDLAQLGFEVERDATRVVVYLPGSPDPWSGSVALVDTDRVAPVAGDVTSMLKTLRGAGRGALAVLAQEPGAAEPVASGQQV